MTQARFTTCAPGRRRVVDPGGEDRVRRSRGVGDREHGEALFPGRADPRLADPRLSGRRPPALRLPDAELRPEFDARHGHPDAVLLEHRAQLRLHDRAAGDDQARRAVRERVPLPAADDARNAGLQHDPERSRVRPQPRPDLGPLRVRVARTGFAGGINYNRVSDDNFFVDFSESILGSSNKVLPQDAFVSLRPGVLELGACASPRTRRCRIRWRPSRRPTSGCRRPR